MVNLYLELEDLVGTGFITITINHISQKNLHLSPKQGFLRNKCTCGNKPTITQLSLSNIFGVYTTHKKMRIFTNFLKTKSKYYWYNYSCKSKKFGKLINVRYDNESPSYSTKSAISSALQGYTGCKH